MNERLIGLLRPIEWQHWVSQIDVGCETFTGNTVLGNYTIDYDRGTVTWGYCFDEYYDEERGKEAESVADAKRQVWEHYISRVGPALKGWKHE